MFYLFASVLIQQSNRPRSGALLYGQSGCTPRSQIREAGLKKLAHTRLPSAWFRSWSRFLAVSLQVTWVINPAVMLPLLSARPAVTLATLKRAATNFSAWWTMAPWHDGCEQVAQQRRGCDLNPRPTAPESSTLTTRLPSHPEAGLRVSN